MVMYGAPGDAARVSPGGGTSRATARGPSVRGTGQLVTSPKSPSSSGRKIRFLSNSGPSTSKASKTSMRGIQFADNVLNTKGKKLNKTRKRSFMGSVEGQPKPGIRLDLSIASSALKWKLSLHPLQFLPDVEKMYRAHVCRTVAREDARNGAFVLGVVSAAAAVIKLASESDSGSERNMRNVLTTGFCLASAVSGFSLAALINAKAPKRSSVWDTRIELDPYGKPLGVKSNVFLYFVAFYGALYVVASSLFGDFCANKLSDLYFTPALCLVALISQRFAFRLLLPFQLLIYIVGAALFLILSQGEGASSSSGLLATYFGIFAFEIAQSVLSDKANRIAWYCCSYLLTKHKSDTVDKSAAAPEGFKSMVLGKRNELSSKQTKLFKYLSSIKNLQPSRIDFRKVEIVKMIGRGAMGEVYRAVYCDTPVAVKRIPEHELTQETIDSFVEECILMQALRHPNVVQMLGVAWDSSTAMVACLVELMPRGSLRSVLQDDSLLLTWEDPKTKFAADIARGMSYLHEKKIVHRDLKTDNILCTSAFTCKVSDFGTSKVVRQQLRTQVGTPFWRAPEILRAEAYDTKADVYSFALVMLELDLERNPFKFLSRSETMELPHKIARENYRMPIPDSVPDEIKTLIEKCWAPDPKDRPSFVLVLRELQLLQKAYEASDASQEWSPNHLPILVRDQIMMSGKYTEKTFADGEVIIKAGDAGECCFIILSGKVDVKIDDAEGAWKSTETLEAPHYFGEMGLIADQVRAATCTAIGETKCLEFDRQTFLEVLDDDIHSQMAVKIIGKIKKASRKSVSEAQRKKMLAKVNSFKPVASTIKKSSSAFHVLRRENSKYTINEKVRSMSGAKAMSRIASSGSAPLSAPTLTGDDEI